MSDVTPTKHINHYFVDEAGDLSLFDRKGRSLLKQPGVSDFFMVGVLQLPDPEMASGRLEELRQKLLRDPYFKKVPSMQPERKKTAVAFHANDDLPEVRHAVFQVLPSLGGKMLVAIKRKEELQRFARSWLNLTGRKINYNELYDDLISRLFKNLLHKADENRIIFSHRGKIGRKTALETTIEKAKKNFAFQSGVSHDKPTTIESGFPSQHIGLQVVDYYLWALQRLYERGEERFFEAVKSDYRLIMDLDDTREKEYGTWYSDSRPLSKEKIKMPSYRLGSTGQAS